MTQSAAERTVLGRLGVRPLVNAAGPLTRLGGGPLAPAVVAAMAEAARSSLKISELQAAAGQVIASATGAEAGYVTSGAAAGLTLSAAACLARGDLALMDRLPDTDGIANEIVVQKPHQVSYNRALRAAGARLVEVGYMGYPGTGATYAWQLEAAIGDRTVAVAHQLVDAPNTIPLAEVVRIAHAHGLPVIVDAAAGLPPPENLRRFVDLGADLVAFSGGKAIGGPQASGLLCGRADLIASVVLQHQDMDVHPRTWERRDEVPGIPHHGIGRAMKVGKEEIVGLVAALEAYLQRDHAADRACWHAQVSHVAAELDGLAGVAVEVVADGRFPVARVRLRDRERAPDVVLALEAGEPRVCVGQGLLDQGVLVVNPLVLQAGEERVVAERLRAVLTSA